MHIARQINYGFATHVITHNPKRPSIATKYTNLRILFSGRILETELSMIGDWYTAMDHFSSSCDWRPISFCGRVFKPG